MPVYAYTVSVSPGGAPPTGGGGGGTVDWDAKYTTALAAARTGGTTRYVDPGNQTGSASNANAGTSRSLPKLNMVNALSTMNAGDELIVIGNGVTITNSANDVLTVGTGANGASWTSGTSYTNMSIVRAETPFGITFKHVTTGDIFGVGCCNMSNNYLWVDGICFEVENFSEDACCNVTGNNNRLTRCLYRSTGTAGSYSEYKQPFVVTGNDNLLQDCHLVGAMRYGYFTGNGGSGPNVKRNLFRRCVARCDGYDASGSSGQPQAVFACYGDNSSTNVVGDMAYQNCIALDSIRASTSGNVDSYTWGAWYNPKITYGNVYRGCIALNCQTSRGTFVVNDNISGGTIATVTNCIAWDTNYATIGAGGPQGGITANSGSSGLYEYCTLGLHDGTMGGVDGNGTETLRNTLFADYTGQSAILTLPSSISYCAFEDGDAAGTNQVTANQTLQWIVRTPYTTQGSTGGNVGAQVEKAWGEFCTHHGQTNYDSVTTDNLWPFPYEDEIKTWFAVSTGQGTSTRGFCSGNSVGGTSQTLTKYIWEYVVNGVQTEIPSGIY